MARARNIKPGIFKNEILGTADPYVSLLFVGLWTLADKSGILEDRPLRIKAEIFPYRDCFDINGYLTVLVTLGFIHRYEIDGVKLIQVINFKKHQNPHHTEKDSEYPDYSEGYKLTVTEPLNNGDTPADSLLLIPDYLSTDIPKKPPASPNGFAEFWLEYPKKVAKADAEKAWKKLKPPLNVVLDVIKRMKTSQDWTKDGGQFIPYPATWLNRRQWEDGVSGVNTKTSLIPEGMQQFYDSNGKFIG